ncbi:MAG: hypothetical protein KDC52_08335, partial [Ignavibacteriae bacterium]|nr:hypothetical protein [Ignavibacteriota bacterium]
MDKAFNIIVPLKKFSLEWSFLAIMMFYPFVATISIFLRIPSRPLSVTYRFCYLVLVLFVLFIEKSKIGKQNIKYSKYFVYLSLFWLLYLLRMYYDLILCGLKVGYASNGFAYYFQYGILGSFLPALVFLLCHREINFRSLFKKLKFFSWPLALCLLYIIDHEFGLNSQIFLSRIYLGEDANIINPI